MKWPERPNAVQAFVGEGITPSLKETGIVGGYEAGFEGGIAANPGGVNLMMAKRNIDAARRASEVLGEEVKPLAGLDWQDDVGALNSEAIPGEALAAYTDFMRAAYDADTFRPDNGDERRIIGDKYKLVRDLGGKSDEQFKRARLIDPSIPDLEEQRRAALADARGLIERSERTNVGLGGTIAWLAGQVMSTVDPTTNPAWALNVLGLGSKTAVRRVGGQAAASATQALTEDLVPLGGLPSREEAMKWIGVDNDVVANALTAAAFGAVLQAGGEVLAKGLAFGSTRVRNAMRNSPPGERIVLDSRNIDGPDRVRDAQDLDAVSRQLDDGVPASDVQPPAAPLGEHASVMPDSRASVDPTVRDTAPASDIEIEARAKKLDSEAHREWGKATKTSERIEAETQALIDVETTRVTSRLDEIDRAIAAAEAKIASLPKGSRATALNEAEALHMQRELVVDNHNEVMATIAKEQAPKQAKAAAKVAKWEGRVERSRARARGEWETAAQAQAVVALERARATGAPAATETPPAVKSAPARPIGEPIEHTVPATESALVADAGEGSVLERVQKVADKNAKEAVEANKAWLTDVKRKLDDLEKAGEAGSDVDPNTIVLADGTPMRDLLNLKAVDIDLADGQVKGAIIDLRKELEDLEGYAEAEKVVTGCQTRS